jgi:hypothetical protein
MLYDLGIGEFLLSVGTGVSVNKGTINKFWCCLVDLLSKGLLTLPIDSLQPSKYNEASVAYKEVLTRYYLNYSSFRINN